MFPLSILGLRGSRVVPAILLSAFALFTAFSTPVLAQKASESERLSAALKAEFPELYTLLLQMERADAAVYGVLARSKGTVKEQEEYGLLAQRVAQGTPLPSPDREAEAGYTVLGTKGAEIVRRTHAFHRELLAVFATVKPADRESALGEAITRYLSRPDVSLPDVAKDMNILYDHPFTSIVLDPDAIPVPAPVRKKAYPNLTGFSWAIHWFELAVQEPLEASADAEERRQGLKLVTDRFYAKLSFGKPPNAFPTELPLSPCIAPGLVSASTRAAAILDNLNMMNEVIADVLQHSDVKNVRKEIDTVIGQFTDRGYRAADEEEWIQVALRHSIFEQGGPAIGIMTRSERNTSGHLQHFKGGGSTIAPGMR